MTQESYTDTDDSRDESMEDSPVMKALRKQINDLQKQVKSAPTRESIEAELREQLAREEAIKTQLIGLGHPAGLSAFVNGKLGDAEVTGNAVADVLRGIGYQVEVDAPATGQVNEPPDDNSDLAQVSSLSAAVRSASDSTPADVITRLNLAKSREELRAQAEEAGLTQSIY